MKRLLFIGAGWEQYELIKTALKMGFEIIATNPTINFEVSKIVDRYFLRKSDDLDAHYKIAKTFKVIGIVTDNCDYSLYTATFVAQKLELPSIGLEAAICAIDKNRQRKKCRNSTNFKQPKHYKFK